ncbi:MAG: 50S ribosomal protein L3 [Deltaproteobacteria bacterium]|nr:50S ribosomal protein L3 [Deltaproteobacteria bacterium]
MTRYRTETGEYVPVTVLEAKPCVVVECKTKATHGYDAIQVAWEPLKRDSLQSKAVVGVTKKRGLAAARVMREFRCQDASQFAPGQQLTVAVFTKGDTVQVQGTTKGRGFQGVIKRCGKHGGPGAHGSHFHRTTGSIGMRTWPARVLKNTGMPGQMGNVTATIRNLEVIDIDPTANVLLVKGGVPGGRNGMLRITNRALSFEAKVLESIKGAASA